jgi:DNA (cytosine-5)-methyltransferase 1
MINGLDLFSGIGGMSRALAPWVQPIAYCEKDRYCQSVLLSRIASGEMVNAPIWDDVTTLTGTQIDCGCDIIFGGFPCQDISVAGTGKGLAGERSGLFYEIVRLAEEIKPQFLFLENVPAIRTKGLSTVAGVLSDLGYDCRWDIVSAAELGGVHIRKRWFLLAYSNRLRLREECGQEVGRDNSQRSRPLESNRKIKTGRTTWSPERLSQPRVDRTGDGIPNRVDRHHGLGNAVVPAQAREAFMRLMGL